MKAGVLGSYILSLTLVFSILSAVVKATECTEVKAEDNLKDIEKGKDVNLTNCHIVGELNLSKIKLETVPNRRFDPYSDYVVNTNLSVIKSSIIIQNSTFENEVNFSNVRFNTTADFYKSTFNNSADFGGANFNNSADFSYTFFNSSASFQAC